VRNRCYRWRLAAVNVIDALAIHGDVRRKRSCAGGIVADDATLRRQATRELLLSAISMGSCPTFGHAIY